MALLERNIFLLWLLAIPLYDASTEKIGREDELSITTLETRSQPPEIRSSSCKVDVDFIM